MLCSVVILVYLIRHTYYKFVSSYTETVIIAYAELLSGNSSITEDVVTLSLHPIDGSRYAIHDMNGDGIPELLTSSVVERYETTDGVAWTVIESSIFSYRDDKVYVWYAGTGHPFQLLKDNTITMNMSQMI